MVGLKLLFVFVFFVFVLLQQQQRFLCFDDEADSNTVSVRARNGDQRAGVSFDLFLEELLEEINNKVATPSLVPPKEE